MFEKRKCHKESKFNQYVVVHRQTSIYICMNSWPMRSSKHFIIVREVLIQIYWFIFKCRHKDTKISSYFKLDIITLIFPVLRVSILFILFSNIMFILIPCFPLVFFNAFMKDNYVSFLLHLLF